MHTSKLWRLIASLLALAIVGAACSSDADEPGGSAAGDDPSSDATTEFDPVNSGQLTVCSDIPYAPFEFEGDDGEFTGFDIEIIREVAADAGLELNVRVTPFDGILGSVEAGDCDLVASALTIKPEREEQVDFSDPYYETDQSLMIKADQADDLGSLADFSGKQIGVQSGTTGADYATENAPSDAEIVEFDGADGLFGAIEAGTIDGILQDEPVNNLRAAADDTLEVIEVFQTDERYGFAVKTGNDGLRAQINATLARIRDSGRYDQIFAEFFG